MKNIIVLFGFILIGISCKKDSNNTPELPTIQVEDSSFVIFEYPDSGQVIGKISATSTKGDVSFSIVRSVPSIDAFSIIPDGSLIVKNKSDLIFSDIPKLVLEIKVTNEEEFKTIFITIELKQRSVQWRLNHGQTPYTIYSDNSDYKDSLDGKWFEYGYIIHYDVINKKTYIADSSSLEGYYKWGCQDPARLDTYGDIGEGERNTGIIMNNCSASYMAATYCINSTKGGFEDWYLPSSYELKLIYDKLFLKGIGAYYKGQLGQEFWSSTDQDKDYGIKFNFDNGSFTIDLKNKGFGSVYPIRHHIEK